VKGAAGVRQAPSERASGKGAVFGAGVGRGISASSAAAAAMLALAAFGLAAEASQPARPVPPRTRRDAPRVAPAGGPGAGAKAGGGPEVVILDGAAIGARMREARGHSLFVHLWASWCGPCLAELPTIDLFARAARARGATFLSVSLDDVARGTHVADVLRQKAPNLTRILARFEDPDRFMAVFSREWEGGIPALFGYDADGRLAGSLMGEADVEDLDRLLEDLTAPVAAPRPPLGPARGPAR